MTPTEADRLVALLRRIYPYPSVRHESNRVVVRTGERTLAFDDVDTARVVLQRAVHRAALR